jgi:TolB-like protein/class 3 adenylate cyclase/Tfp pilus assembly protein PilF
LRSRSASAAQAERQLVAVVAADIAGYSRLMGADEERTLAQLKACRRELIDPGIERHRGRIVKTTGDGLLIEFTSPVEAVRWAVETQQGMNERNADVAEDRRIFFRVGINLGDVIVDDKDLYGDAVNIAARLENLADPGGICISRSVREQIRDRLALPFADGGEQSVKNIARPIRVYALSADAVAALPRVEMPAAPRPAKRPYERRNIAAVAAAGVLIIASGLWWLVPSAKAPSAPATVPSVEKTAAPAEPPAASRLSIVVLPFKNLSDDREQQYFADGITEGLTTDLSRITGSFVISRNTAFTYKDKPVNAKQIGRELGVRYVLEGSVQRSAKQVRVNAQLIDAETDAHLWAERFDSDIGDLLALQNEITARIGNSLGVALINAEAARPTANPDALDYILRGRAAFAKGFSRENIAEAIGLFERALVLDPRSWMAQGELGQALTSRVLEDMTDSRDADIGRAGALIGQVLAASPSDSRAHFVKGQMLRSQGRCEEALPEYEMVSTLNRNSAVALVNIGRCRLLTGLLDEALPPMEQAIRLSPRDPSIAAWYSSIGQVHLLQSRTDEAILWLEKSRSANPGRPVVHIWLAAAYGLKGETKRAAAELAEARRLSSDDRFSSIARLRRGYLRVPKVRDLYEATYFTGLRKAGMPEE